MTRPRTIFITQWYPPEPGPAVVPHVIAQAVAHNDWDVDVLTGFPNYPTGRLPEGWKMSWLQRSVRDGVRVWRVPLFASHDASAIKRIANYGSFGLSASAGYAWARLSGKLQRPEVQWVSYSPVTVGIAQLVARAIDGTPTVVWVGDLWPDTVGVSGLEGARGLMRLAGKAMHAWCNLLYAQAEAIVVISPGVREVLISRGVPEHKVHFIPVAPDEQVFQPCSVQQRAQARDHYGTQGQRRVLLYAGAMGEAQELQTLIRAAARAGAEGPEVVLAGSGTQEEELMALAADLGAPVRFLGRVPQEEMTQLLAAADAAYIGLADAPLSGITMPSKTQSIIASHTPILCCAFGDVAAVVLENDLGLVSAPGDVDALAQTLRDFAAASDSELAAWRANAAKAHRERFSASIVGERTSTLLREVADGGKAIDAPTDEVEAVAGIAARDARALAHLHVRAFPGFFLAQLGPKFLSRFYRGYAHDPSAVGITYRKRGRVIGSVVGTTDPNGFYSRLLKRDLFGFGWTAAMAALRNPKAAGRLFQGLFYRGEEAAEIPGAALLASVCLDPEERGGGLGKQMIRDFFGECARRGAGTVVLTTDAENNDAVNTMYQRLGGKLVDSYTTSRGRKMNKYAYELEELGFDVAK
ncbi:GNAT family N-acetyltransferase [Corynebacterium gerontici]|uniref:Putative glycosyl transferase n=1 Tax=Corynebacterium gerontici TaxID=2079234 RepID=A0A3G6IXE3_9CORY|nr:GNAT family N-acetyltransferase [Corynebacterium gerontici]AZA10441.1 putative glycosyl transferase [Corynebacterium gerontici]